ncbi:MAG: hypothetical protein WCR24_03600 [Candidatus Methanomethylophilaceae archaeon]
MAIIGNKKKETSAIGDNIDARKREVKMRKQEEAAEKKRIANLKREQSVREKESKRKVREAQGGTGFKIILFDLPVPSPRSKKKKTCKKRSTKKRK